MTDAELNKAVAEEVMGWKYLRTSSVNSKPIWNYGTYEGVREFEPATDYVAMGEVIEAMRAKGWSMYAFSDIVRESLMGWDAAFLKHGIGRANVIGIDTLPRAVALAALEACRKEKGR